MSHHRLLNHALWAGAVVGAYGLGSLRDDAREPKNGEESRPASGVQVSVLESSAATITVEGDASAEGRRSGPRSQDVSAIGQLFGSDALGGSDWETLARQSVRDPNPITRRLAFTRLLEALTPENAVAIREQLVAFGAEGDQWRDFNYSWGALAGEEAFAFAAASKEPDLEAAVAGWASARPDEAIAMLDNLPEEMRGNRDSLAASIVSGLADRDPMLAADLVVRLASEGNERAPQLMDQVASELLRVESPERASAWAESLPDGPVKGAAMRRVADRFAAADPEAAAAWAERFADQEYAAPVIQEVGREWARRSPLEAVAWLQDLPEGPGQSAGLSSAFGDWEDRDPALASEYLAAMPDSPQRDAAISGFSSGYAWQDPLVAIAWAEDISDPNLRQQSLTRAGMAFMRRDPESAREWLPVSGLPPEAQEAVLNPPRRRR